MTLEVFPNAEAIERLRGPSARCACLGMTCAPTVTGADVAIRDSRIALTARMIVRPRESSDRAELFGGDFEGAEARGVIEDLRGGDDLVGVGLFE